MTDSERVTIRTSILHGRNGRETKQFATRLGEERFTCSRAGSVLAVDRNDSSGSTILVRHMTYQVKTDASWNEMSRRLRRTACEACSRTTWQIRATHRLLRPKLTYSGVSCAQRSRSSRRRTSDRTSDFLHVTVKWHVRGPRDSWRSHALLGIYLFTCAPPTRHSSRLVLARDDPVVSAGDLTTVRIFGRCRTDARDIDRRTPVDARSSCHTRSALASSDTIGLKSERELCDDVETRLKTVKSSHVTRVRPVWSSPRESPRREWRTSRRSIRIARSI